ncbi:MAG: DUF2867 domain-containing protein [Bifidobacteriaceae bacterium]|nr:DUF2867 domain-containing protein [Bifidobacteriaceae bacterium]
MRRSLPGRLAFADAWAVEVRPDDPTDPREWARALFRAERLPPLIRWVFAMRNKLEYRLGAKHPGVPEPYTGFPIYQESGNRLMVGVDQVSLSFRVDLIVLPRQARVATAVCLHNRLGRLYWGFVRPLHPSFAHMTLSHLYFDPKPE